ncbi:hypothetical protein H1R20_g11857, partial [Candolleomyces eurysporus]
MATPIVTDTPLREQVSRVADISRQINDNFEQAAQIAIKSGNNEQLTLFRTRFNSLRNASKDVAFEIVTLLKRFKGIVLTVEEVASREARDAAIEELKYFVNERYSKSARTIMGGFDNLRYDLQEFIAGTSSGDLKEQLRYLVQQASDLKAVWDKILQETNQFREAIAGAVETPTNMLLKRRVRLAASVADVLGASLEVYLAEI